MQTMIDLTFKLSKEEAREGKVFSRLKRTLTSLEKIRKTIRRIKKQMEQIRLEEQQAKEIAAERRRQNRERTAGNAHTPASLMGVNEEGLP